MLLALLHVARLVALVLASDPDVGICNKREWFGEHCLYRCHCLGNADCDDNGDCDGGNQCEESYFGPGCQYFDIAHNNQGVETVPPDFNKDGTPCKQRTSQNSVSLTFPKDSQPLFWFRIKTLNSEFLHNFSVTINDHDICHNERRFHVSATELDVSCDTNALLGKLELHGPVAQTICSIKVTKGRNVGVNQQTWQSSTININGLEILQSDKANDDDYNTCSRTTNSLEVSGWELVFNRPQLVSSVFITASNKISQYDLHGFELRTYNEVENDVETYLEPNKRTQNYTVALKLRQPVQVLKIIKEPFEAQAFLALCEVHVFGETLCPDGTYGLYCNHKCTCNEEEICNLATGACAPGCPKGLYGFNCSQACSKWCYHSMCHHRFGKCLQCAAGHSGKGCEQSCTAGHYGVDCNSTCSPHCLGTCDRRTGECHCEGNFSQPLCIDCEPGYYGENCNLSCADTCVNYICNMSTGYCTTCNGARIGQYCQECPIGYYGSSCLTKCSVYCLNGTCDPDDGTCPTCVDGYFGPKCVIAEATYEMLHGLLVSLPFVAICMFVCAVSLLRKRHSRLHDESEEADNSSFSSTSPSHTLSKLYSTAV